MPLTNENIVFPLNSGVVIGKAFSYAGIDFSVETNRRTNLPFDIKGDGVTDDTQQIQDLLDCQAFFGSNMIAYLPNSTYLVSDTLYWFGYLIINGSSKINVTVTSGSATITGTSGTFTGVNVGDSVRGTGIHPGTTVTAVASSSSITISQVAWTSWSEGNRQKRLILQGQSAEGTILKLADNAANFQNAGSPRAVVHTGLIPAQRFRNSVRNLTIDVGTGNAGAIGLRYCAHNQGSARDLIIKSSDPGKIGHSGIDIAYSGEPGPCLVKNVKIIGFTRGILSNHPVASATFEYIELEDQLQYGIYQGDNSPQTLFLRKITSKNSVPVYYDINSTNSQSVPVIMDCDFHNDGTPTAATAIQCNRTAIFVRNVTCSDYAKSLTNAVDSAEIIGNISEYSAYNGANLGYSSSTKINNGVNKSVGIPVLETPEIPWEQDLTKWATGTTSEQIQAAIDTPGITTIYIPLGTRTLNSNVFVRGDVNRIIGCEATINGTGRLIIEEGTSNTVVIERLAGVPSSQIVNLSSRTLVMSSCSIDAAPGVFSFTNIGSDISINKIGTGKLFLEDVVCDSITAYGIDIYARQLNMEGVNAKGMGVFTKCNFFCFGIKTEKENIIAYLKDSKAEIYMLSYATSGTGNKIKPLIYLDNSDYSGTLFEASFASLPFLLKEVAVNNGEIKAFPKTTEGITGESISFLTNHKFNSDKIRTSDIAPSIVNCSIENGTIRVGDVNNAWDESFSDVFGTTKQLAIAVHLSEIRDTEIRNNSVNGAVSLWSNKGKNTTISLNKFDFEKTNSTGKCVYAHDTGLKIDRNFFVNYETAIISNGNALPGAYASLTTCPSPLISYNIFVNPVSSAALSFSTPTFASFPFRFYNNTVITRDQTKAPLTFGNSFQNSSAFNGLTSSTNIYSDFKNNIFYSVNATNTSGIPTTGSTTKTNNSFFNTTAVGSSNQTFISDFSGSLGVSLWEYKLTSNSALRTTGAVISGVTPASNVSIGALQAGSEWTLDTPGNTGKKVNLLPSSDAIESSGTNFGSFAGASF